MGALLEPPPLLAVLAVVLSVAAALWFGLGGSAASPVETRDDYVPADEEAEVWGLADPPAKSRRALAPAAPLGPAAPPVSRLLPAHPAEPAPAPRLGPPRRLVPLMPAVPAIAPRPGGDWVAAPGVAAPGAVQRKPPPLLPLAHGQTDAPEAAQR